MKQFSFKSCLISVLIISSCSCSGFAVSISEINTLSQQSKYIADQFMQATFETRLGYEYRGHFLSDAQRSSFYDLAKKAVDELQDIVEKQRRIRHDIENYSGEDWETKFNDTGIWQTLAMDVFNSTGLKSQIGYYQALASPSPEQVRLLNHALDELAFVKSIFPDDLGSKMLRGDIYVLLSRTGQGSASTAAELYREVMKTPKIADEYFIPAQVSLFKIEPPQLVTVYDELADHISQSGCKDDFELNLTVALLQHKRGANTQLAKLLNRLPQAKTILGQIILSDVHQASQNGTLNQLAAKLDSLELDCAAAASSADPKLYVPLLERLISANRTTRALLTACALAHLNDDASKSVLLLMQASRLDDPNSLLQLKPIELARKAAALAFKLPQGTPDNQLAKKAFANYLSMTDLPDPQIEYSFASVLKYCNDETAAIKLLQKIANNPKSPYSCNARFDLISAAVSKEQSADTKLRLVRQLKPIFVSDSSASIDKNLKLAAAQLYCRQLLESHSNDQANELLAALPSISCLPNAKKIGYQAQALLGLGQNDGACKALLTYDANMCSIEPIAAKLLTSYSENIEENAAVINGLSLRDYGLLAKRISNCPQAQSDPAIVAACFDIELASAGSDQTKIDALASSFDKLCSSLPKDHLAILTSNARLLMARKDYERAAQLWQQISAALKAMPSEPVGHSKPWWQAKYFELLCASKFHSESAEIRHTIEVLQSTFSQIPPFWSARLESLKSQ